MLQLIIRLNDTEGMETRIKYNINTNTYHNSTTNRNPFCTTSKSFTAIYGTLASLFALASLIGNILSLIVIKKYPVVRGPNNKYLLAVHLSVIHLLLSIVVLTYPFEAISFSSTFSEIREAMVLSLIISNGATLFIGACKRMFVNFLPFVYYEKKHYENRILACFLSLFWVIAISVGFSSITTKVDHSSNNDIERIATWSALTVSTTTRMIASSMFFTFCLITFIFYIIIFFQFRRRNHNLNLSVNKIPQPVIVSIVRALTYTVCWVPYSCVLLALGTNQYPPCCMCSFMLMVGFLDMAISWPANPIIDVKYKKAFLNLLCNIPMEV